MKHPKSVIFFDGDGTLWYPKSTKRTKAPHWVYDTHSLIKDYLPHLVVTPSLVKTLKELKKRGAILVIVSNNPHPQKKADFHMNSKVVKLKLDSLFDYVYSARPFVWGKGKVMVSFLKKNKIPKTQALLVGDSYVYDYLSAKAVGIDCLLINTPYLKHPKRGRKMQYTINHLKELLSLPKP